MSMRLLPLLWFSMKLGMINSFLIVCFTMVQKKKKFKLENIYKICAKVLHNGYKTTFTEKCIKFTINIRKFYQIFFPKFDQLSIL